MSDRFREYVSGLTAEERVRFLVKCARAQGRLRERGRRRADRARGAEKGDEERAMREWLESS
jgi:hypothetical protein